MLRGFYIAIEDISVGPWIDDQASEKLERKSRLVVRVVCSYGFSLPISRDTKLFSSAGDKDILIDRGTDGEVCSIIRKIRLCQ